MTKKQMRKLGKQLNATIEKLQREEYDVANCEAYMAFRHVRELTRSAVIQLRIAYERMGYAREDAAEREAEKQAA